MKEEYFAEQMIKATKYAVGSDSVGLHGPTFYGNEWLYLNECLDSSYVSSVGKFVDRIEQELAEFTGANFAICVVNRTLTLQIALKLAGVEVNDVALTFIAIANAISYCNAAANLIADLMGKEVKIILDNDRIRPKDSEVERLFASNAKAKDLFGWKPSESGLAGFESGLKKTIDCFKYPENLANYKSSIFKI